MSLRPPRRIFARKKRLPAMLAALRSVALLSLGFTAALGATMVAAKWPDGQTVSHTQLPASFEVPALRAHDPVLRVAAVAVPHNLVEMAPGSGRHAP